MESKTSPNLHPHCPSTEVTALLSLMFCVYSKHFVTYLLRHFMLYVFENPLYTGFNFKKNMERTDFHN